jgi:hypothetical protein
MKAQFILLALLINFQLQAQSIQINEAEASVKFVFVDDDVVSFP